MSGVGVRLVAVFLGVGAVAGLGALSQVPWPWRGPQHAVIRLTWRARGHRLEECRRLSPDELAKLPVHMRREEVCEGRILAYGLRVSLDGRTVVDEMVRPAGARADRPLYVFHEIPVPPGERVLGVSFLREDVLEGAARSAEEERERGMKGDSAVGQRSLAQEAPAELRFAGRLRLEAGQVALVTYDPDERRIVVQGYGGVP